VVLAMVTKIAIVKPTLNLIPMDLDLDEAAKMPPLKPYS
jgi:hypothetical protein